MEANLKKLYPVLLGIHLVALPLYTRTPLLILLVVLLLTVWAFFIIAKRIKQPSDFIRILVLVASVLVLILSYGTIFGQQPGTSLLLLLSLLKIFEIKSKRDVSVIIFMGYFLIASNFFYTQSILTTAYVFLVVIYLSSVLIYLNDTLGTISLKQRLQSAGQFIALAFPFMLILFVLFPRIPSPLWGLPKDAFAAKTGLSEEMTLDNISQLVSSGEVAFRVSFKGEPPPHNILYWRGPVLSQYDGKTWRKNYAPGSAIANLITKKDANSYNYTVTLEPHNKNWLFSLEHPINPSGTTRLTRELQLINNNRVTNVISYTLTSMPAAVNVGLFEQEAYRNLLLPFDINPRTKRLAQRFFQQSNGNPEAIINAALNYFRKQNFYYTLSPPALVGDAMDSFLFDTKRGFCGHYASAFVTLMRSAGIPSRVVTGYQGGTINPLDNYMIVRQSDAHAWTEVWIENKGWVRVDPTAAISPSRIESGIADAGLEPDKLPAILIGNNAFLNQTRFIIDSMHNSWNKWVIGYNQKKQKQLFNKLGIEKIDAGELTLWLVIAMTIAGAIITSIVLRTGTPKNKDKALYYYNAFCSKFIAAGLIREHHEGENDFLTRIKQQFPHSARAAEIITNSYQQIRYNNRTDLSYQKNFIRVVKNFKVIPS